MRKKTMELMAKRKFAFVYLYHRMFKEICKGDIIKYIKTMNVADMTADTFRDWNAEYAQSAIDTINGENGTSTEEESGTPTIKGIKEKSLKRINGLVNLTDDPARLAQVYKILSEFESTDEKKEKSVIDAVNENVQPLLKKDEETPVTMMDVLRAEGKATIVPAKRGPGRPKKVVNKMDE
ncbi:MAG: hypothetical protein IJU69_07250 [Bacteroidales bacterium]|nr:hypothetical protein [Bacteroidales bacterium]